MNSWLSVVIVGLILLLAIPIASCDKSPEYKPFPQPEPATISKTTLTQEPTPEPSSSPAPSIALTTTEQTTTEPKPREVTIKEPLTYEVVKSWVEEDTIIHISTISIEGIGESEQIEEIPLYIIYVTIKNTDNVSGNFKIAFSVDEPLDTLFLNKRFDLGPGETTTLSCLAYILGDWKYIITPSEKTVTKTVYD